MASRMPKSTVVTTRIDEPTAEALDALALRLDRSRAWIVAKAVSRYVKDQARLLDLIREGDDSIDRGEYLTQDQMEEWLRSLRRADAA
jgi:predicted transcriptional regulator